MRLVSDSVVATVIDCGMPLPGWGVITEAETDKHVLYYSRRMVQLACHESLTSDHVLDLVVKSYKASAASQPGGQQDLRRKPP